MQTKRGPHVRTLRRRAMTAGMLVACAVLVACHAAPPAKAPVQPGPTLWRLTDADSEIWILGSVHVLPPGLKWRTPAIDAAFAAADVVVFETPTDAAAQADIAATVRATSANPPGVTLSSLLSEAEAAKLHRVAKGLGVEPATLEPLRPWLAAVALSMRSVVAQGHDPNSGVEQIGRAHV